MIKKITLLAFCYLISLQISSAQWSSNLNQNTVVSDNATQDEIIPKSAPGPNGTVYISWFQANGSGSYNACMQLLDSNGLALWPSALIVSSHPQSSALYLHDFVSDSSGNALFAFQDIRNGNTETVIYKVNSMGQQVWGPDGIQLHDSLAVFEVAPRIAVYDNDDVVVCWSASDNGSDKWVAFQHFSSSGTPTFTNPLRITSATENYSRAVPVVSGGPEFIIVYVKETGSFPALQSRLQAQTFDLSGNTVWATPCDVSTYALGFVSWPYVVADGGGGVFVGFNSGTPGAPAVNDAFLQHVGSGGFTNFGTDGLELIGLTGQHKFIYDLFFDDFNGNIITLLKVTDSGQNGAGVYLQSVSVGATVNYGVNGLEISPVSVTEPCEPANFALTDNAFFLLWSAGTFGNKQIWAQKVDLNGVIQFASPLAMCTAVSDKDELHLVHLKNTDQVVASWSDTRINNGVYAQNLYGNGSSGVITSTSLSGLQKKIKAFYNSNQQSLFITGSDKGNVLIYDAGGRLMQSENLINGNINIPLSYLNDGVYFYRIVEGSQTVSGKFVKL